jgi:two-component system, response regulator PdtaR
MSNVLIVEDDIAIADLLQGALESDGHVVVGIANTVDKAMELTARHQPDVAIVDVRLAKGDLGTEYATRIRARGNLPVLFSTGSCEDPVLTKSDGDAVMIKPYLMKDVCRALSILSELATFGQTSLVSPRNFRLLGSAAA